MRRVARTVAHRNAYSAAYAIARRIAAAAAIGGLATASAVAVADPAALAETARCGMCHHAETQRLGPSWAAIAERYAGDDSALATLTTRVRAGGSGGWGKAPMPPVSDGQLSDDDLASVLAWILER